MNYSKIIFFIVIAFILSLGAVGYAIRSKAAQQDSQNVSQAAEKVKTAAPALRVTVMEVNRNKTAYINLLGTVKSENLVKVFPAASGQITAVHAKEGSHVNQGDVLFEIGGINGGKHALAYQLEIARANYESAQRAYELVKQGNDVSYETAWLQLQSARNQLQGTRVDLEVINRNLESANNGLAILNNSLQATRYKNEQDRRKTQLAISGLQQAINELSLNRQQTQDPAALAEIDKTLKDLNTQLTNAQIGYETLQAGTTLSENQILAQIQQGNAQLRVLELNEESARKKLGLDDSDISDAVKMAEEGIDGIETKNETSLLQTETQLMLAKKNYELAKLQQDTLVIKAPSSGLLAEVAVSNGDMVNPQLMLTQIVNSNNFELKVAVDADTANKIKQGTAAEVQIGGVFEKTKVASVSPIADAASKMVNVTLELPNTFFRTNQTLNARIALAAGSGSGAYFVPLDALIIGTEEKYVFAYENGKAKKINVKVGMIENDQAEILEGLSEFDKIIVDGAKNLIEGQAITLQ